MNGAIVNSSLSPSLYYWYECGLYNNNGSTGTLRGPLAGFLILQFTYCFELLVGAPSNLWLICHILRQRSKVACVPPADFFPLHLAVTQMSFYLALPPFFANHFLWQSNRVQNLVSVLNSMVFVMKPLLLCLVCVERYMAVVRPLDYQRVKTPRYRWGSVGVAWCIYVFMASGAIVTRSPITLSLVFLPVLGISTFCSLSVLKTLKKPPPGHTWVMERKKKKKKVMEERETGKQGSQGVEVGDGEKKQSRINEGGSKAVGKKVGRNKPRGKGVMNSTKKKAFINIVIIQAVLTINYLPMIATMPMEIVVLAPALRCQYVAMALAAAESCSYLQPLLYLHRFGWLPCMMSQNP